MDSDLQFALPAQQLLAMQIPATASMEMELAGPQVVSFPIEVITYEASLADTDAATVEALTLEVLVLCSLADTDAETTESMVITALAGLADSDAETTEALSGSPAVSASLADTDAVTTESMSVGTVEATLADSDAATTEALGASAAVEANLADTDATTTESLSACDALVMADSDAVTVEALMASAAIGCTLADADGVAAEALTAEPALTADLADSDAETTEALTATGEETASATLADEDAVTTEALTAAIGFTTKWTVSGDATARTITLPLPNTRSEGTLSYNFTVDWGDGSSSTVTAYNDANRIHTYADNGTYTVTITGTCEGWYFNNAGDKLKIVEVVNWGESPAFNGFKRLYGGFNGCSNLISVGTTPIPASGAGIASEGFYKLFYNTAITSVPSDIFRYHPNAVAGQYIFGNTPITALPNGVFGYNTLISNFYCLCFGCSVLATVGDNLFRNNTACLNFTYAFYGCNKAQLKASMFYATGEASTRFLGKTVDFNNFVNRSSFTGSQGTAPDFWECDFGESITLDVAPAVDWAADDVITGQTSAATAVVVSKVSTYVYKIKKHFGAFALGEIVGVTGNADKLADQGATKPTFSGTPIFGSAFAGAGNSATSLTNNSSIPASCR
jgi:hypothetical protein